MTRSAYMIAALVVLLTGCSAEKRLNKLLFNHPEFRDTVVIHDTVTAIVEYVHHDTAFVSLPGDTVRIDDGRLHVRYLRLPGDTVWLEGACDPDTVTVVSIHEVPVIQPTLTKSVMPWWVWLIIGGLVVLLIVENFRK